MIKLLEGVKVLDFTAVVLGPFMTQLMGDLGAEVIKVESLDGDIYRGVHPQKNAKMGAGFLNCNRSKRSISINAKSEEGLEIIKKLILRSDVFIHNMRQSSIDRLHLSYKEVAAINPSIIYCGATGFGHQGPYKDRPAYDDVIQSMTGMADLMKDENGNPRFVPSIISDKIAGLYALYGVLSALHYKNKTGNGVELEVPMYESIASFLLSEHLQGHIYDPPIGDVGYKRILSEYCKPHKTSDGYITITPYSYQNYIQLFQLMNRHDILDEEWLKDAVQRSKRTDFLYQIIDDETLHHPTSYWKEELEKRDIPCSIVQSLEDLFEDAHLREVSFFKSMDHHTEGKLNVVRSPIEVNGQFQDEYAPPPNLGENTLEILKELKYSDEKIEDLIRSKNISI